MLVGVSGVAVESVLLWVVVAYVVGAIPTGVLLAWTRGIDLRAAGSGNTGATNAARVLGTSWGLVVFVLDALKAALPVFLAAQPWALGRWPSPEPALAIVAFTAVLGHVFPIYLGFRGGKGVACALGVFLALDGPVALAALVMYGQGLWLTQTSAIGSLTAVTAITVCLVIADKPWAYQLLALAIAIVIWLRHIPNVRQIVAEAKARKRSAAPTRP